MSRFATLAAIVFASLALTATALGQGYDPTLPGGYDPGDGGGVGPAVATTAGAGPPPDPPRSS